MKEMFKPIEHNGKSYNIVFNLNVMEIIQDEYGTLEKWGELTDGKAVDPETGKEKEVDIKALLFGFREMLNEGIEIENEKNGTNEPLLTRKQVGRIITDIGLENATEALNSLVVESTENGDSKNA